MAEQSQALHTDNAGKRTSAVWADDGDGTTRWLLWARNAVLELLARTVDAVAGATDRGIMALAVRRDTAAGPGTDGDYASLSVDSVGRLRVLDDSVAGYPSGATPTTDASGVVSDAAAVATLAAGGAGVTTYITGLIITGAGATAASVVDVTIAGVIDGTITLPVVIPAGVTTAITPLELTFPAPIPASAANTAIVVTAPAFGSGNTDAAAAAFGFTL